MSMLDILDTLDMIDNMPENTVEPIVDENDDGGASDAIATEGRVVAPPLKVRRRRVGSKKEAKPTTECPICCETYNRALRTEIICTYEDCHYSACKTCVRTYLTNTTQEPHCMNCKKPFDDEFMFKHLNKSYCKTEFRDHRRKILFDLEVSKIPETMPAVETQLRVEEIQHKNDDILDEIVKLEREIHELRNNIHTNHRQITRLRGGGDAKTEEKRKFVMPCPNDGCRGFLSSAYKCEICKYFTCPKCLELVGTERGVEAPREGDGEGDAAVDGEVDGEVDIDENEEGAGAGAGAGANDVNGQPAPRRRHVCNPDCVKNAEAIKRDTRACPSCGSRIYKIEGCSQIWCTSCHVAFDWNTGRVDNGIIHNPHFFEWQRKGGGAARVAGAGAPQGAQCDVDGAANAWTNMRYRLYSMIERVQKYVSEKRLVDAATAKMRGGYTQEFTEEIRDRSIHKLHDIRTLMNMFGRIVRNIEHVANVVMRDARGRIRSYEDNNNLRILYILKRVTDEFFADTVYKNSIQRKKLVEKYHVYEILTTVGREWVRSISTNEMTGMFMYIPAAPEIWDFCELEAAMDHILGNYRKKLTEIEEFFKYCNQQFWRIGKLYNERAYGMNLTSDGCNRYEWMGLTTPPDEDAVAAAST